MSASATQRAQGSRLMVRNLPKHLSLERLRAIFGARGGNVTDVRLARDKDGKSRRFGFIGYASETDAADALKYFNNSFIDTSKIEVSFAKPVGDGSIPRPWSKHSVGSSAHQRQELKKQQQLQNQAENRSESVSIPKQTATNLLSDLKTLQQTDPKFKEFLDVMRPRGAAKSRTWANDDESAGVDLLWDPSAASKRAIDEEDDELYQDLDKNAADAAKIEATPEPETAEETDQPDSIAHNAGLSDMEYLRARMRSRLDEDFFGTDDAEDGKSSNLEDSKPQIPVSTDIQEVADSSFEVAAKESSKLNAKKGKSKVIQQIKEIIGDAEENTNSHILPINSNREVKSLVEDEAIPPADIIADTGRLFVKNLAFTCTEEDLKNLVGKFGPLSEVHLSIDRETKKPRGYAFVLFMLPEHAVKAYTSLDGQIFQGRILEVLPGKDKSVPADDELVKFGAQSSYKTKLEVKKKKEAANEYSWNSLFINSDAVAEAMARKLKVKKSDILDPSSENMAVRLALAETDIINETKTFLEEEGIDLDSFTRSKARSNTILLAKNIPAGTTVEEIEGTFAKFGSLGRIVVPPSGTVAMVEFLEPNECKTAFRRLAYTKFKTLPLFLEFAPIGAFKKGFDKVEYDARKKARVEMSNEKEVGLEESLSAPSLDAKLSKSVAATTKKASKKQALEKAMEPSEALGNITASMDDPDAMPIATLFVKNLSFDTTEDGLRKKFSAVGGLRSVRIATKPDPKKGAGAVLSMGFGFLEFDRKEDAIRAVKALQGAELDGHKLQLKFSNAAERAKGMDNSKRKVAEDDVQVTGTKLIIRNIPFQATKRDLKQLFSTFGQLKTVRLTLKFDGSHRGFGFVDFLTKQEAKAAFDTLGSTHLYGRHLVMEWAEDESSVEAMRSKTAKNYSKSSGDSTKRRKVLIGGDDAEDISE
ncbi:putative RNA-binding protein 19 [Entophlyctis sp. JEL0112]|nr:putative RNA-binding protein 19 [Entophlyctis sp. JEL0112]